MNEIEQLPRQLEVLRQLTHPLHVKGKQFKNMNEAKLRIREMNEVALTAANFADAIGVQQHAKDLINRSC